MVRLEVSGLLTAERVLTRWVAKPDGGVECLCTFLLRAARTSHSVAIMAENPIGGGSLYSMSGAFYVVVLNTKPPLTGPNGRAHKAKINQGDCQYLQQPSSSTVHFSTAHTRGEAYTSRSSDRRKTSSTGLAAP